MAGMLSQADGPFKPGHATQPLAGAPGAQVGRQNGTPGGGPYPAQLISAG
jgi:hypothetical protein